MPKIRRKDRSNHKASVDVTVGSDDDDCGDTVSIFSNQSEQHITDGSEDLETDESSTQEDLEEKIKANIDGTAQKSAKGRVECLKGLKSSLCKKYLFDFISDRKVTICDSLERCLKRGKGDEQVAAANCIVLLLVQLGASDDKDEIFRSVIPCLKFILADASASNDARSACAEALALCTFIAAEENKDILETMTALESIFKQSYSNGDGSIPVHTPQASALHNSALAAWTLLLSIIPPSAVLKSTDMHLTRLPQMLSSADTELRITAGEAIALVYELIRGVDEDFEGDGFGELCQELKKLSTECNKYRAKKDRRLQKSSFRDILRAVECGDFNTHNVKVNSHESVTVDTWAQKTQYNALCHVLGSGMNIHLQENSLLRDIFFLGPPIPMGTPLTGKASKAEKHMFREAAFKERTKCRSKQREKKAVIVNGE